MTRRKRSTLTFTDQLAALDDARGPAYTSQPLMRAQRSPSSPQTREHVIDMSESQRSGLMPLDDEFKTVAEVALILRFVERHVRRLIDEGELKASHFGRAVRIRRVDLDDYITRGSKPRARKSKRN